MSASETKTSGLQLAYIITLVVMVISIIGNVLLYKENVKLSNSNSTLTAMADTYKKQIVEITDKYAKSDIAVKTMVDELNSLNKRLKDIKNGDDLLKRDIFLYIDTKFSRVPDSVSKEIADEILQISKEENISPELIMGIMQVESSFNPLAISNKGARGLMQVMPAWAKKFELEKVSDLHNIDTNIECGVRVLKIHIDESKGSLTKGLYHYVGKSDSYAGKVYQAMGQFIAFRSNVPDDNEDSSDNEAETEAN